MSKLYWVRKICSSRPIVAMSVASAILVAPCARLAAQQQQPTIVVQTGITLERDTVTVGDVVKLQVRVRAPKGAIISFPSAVDSLGPVQALEPPIVHEGTDSVDAADRVAIYRLAAWNVGQQPIKLGEVLVQTDAGDRRVALNLPTLFVKTVLPADTAQRIPKPARPLLDAVVTAPWWWWVLGALAIGALVYGIWRWIARRRTIGRKSGDPYADAAAAFANVENLRLLDAGEPGRHAALMADVVRRYLSERITGVSLAHTTQELLDVVRDSPTVTAESLRAMLDPVDQIKFARAPIAADQARQLGEEAKIIVRSEHERAEAFAASESGPAERAA